ncbi:MAG: thioesterase domain-containing protein [Bacteroidota bacterium]
MQIYFLPFSGGSYRSYEFMRKHFPKGIDLHFLELPGRGGRYGEPLLNDYRSAVADYLRQIRSSRRQDMPYIVYGHSLGSILSLEVIKQMEKSMDHPNAMVVSGNPGPGVSQLKNRNYGNLGKQDFKNKLIEMGGTAQEVLDDEELFDFFEPIIRGDFRILDEGYPNISTQKINTPIFAIMGNEEKTVKEIENWGRFTTKRFESLILKGNHFFIYDYPETLAKIIAHPNGFFNSDLSHLSASDAI